MVYTDGLQLYRETFSQAYSYDENGNLVSSALPYRSGTKATYDSSNNCYILDRSVGRNDL